VGTIRNTPVVRADRVAHSTPQRWLRPLETSSRADARLNPAAERACHHQRDHRSGRAARSHRLRDGVRAWPRVRSSGVRTPLRCGRIAANGEDGPRRCRRETGRRLPPRARRKPSARRTPRGAPHRQADGAYSSDLRIAPSAKLVHHPTRGRLDPFARKASTSRGPRKGPHLPPARRTEGFAPTVPVAERAPRSVGTREPSSDHGRTSNAPSGYTTPLIRTSMRWRPG
jgi:hypothetical protein